MALKTKFFLLSIILCAGLLTLSCLFVQKYHSHIPVIKRWFHTTTNPEDLESPINPYKGLKPMKNDPNGIYYKDNVIVLMYHDVGPNPLNRNSLPLAKFESQLTLMQANNFHWITMDQYRNFILHANPVPVNAVLLTFDDGYESFYKFAYPLLEKYHAPASSFLIVNTVGNPSHIGLTKLTWEQVKLMHQHGIDFYNHTFDSHMYMPIDSSGKHLIPMLAGRIYNKLSHRRETESEYEQRITSDLKKANGILDQQLGIHDHVLAFPYGAFSKPLLKICKQLGIDITLTVKEGMDKSGQTNGFRVNAGGAANNPDLQLSLMKQAPKLLANSHFEDEGPHRTLHFTYGILLVVMLSGMLWLRTWRRLYRERLPKKNDNN
jgi:biofilm PGA synthesis lipoprotein PgaB